MAGKRVLSIDPGLHRPMVAVFTMDEKGNVRPDELAIYRSQRRVVDNEITIFPKNKQTGNYFEFRLGKERSLDSGLKHFTCKFPHQMPPGFPFRDIPTEMMVADIPHIHALRQLGLEHMTHHLPSLRRFFGRQDHSNGESSSIPHP